MNGTQPSLSNITTLSLAAPAYNEAQGIASVVRDWHEFLCQHELEEFEIVICNDGSKDETGAILDQLTKTYPQLRPIHFPNNQGAAAALTAAIQATNGEWVLLLDSDGQFPIENLPAMFDAINQSGRLAAIGVRAKKDNIIARFGSWASGLLCNLAHASHMRDFNSAFKLVSGPVVRKLHLEARGMNYSTEVTSRLLECGIIPVEVNINHCPRTTGVSNMRLLKGARDRFLFVCYVMLRQLLISCDVLRRPLP